MAALGVDTHHNATMDYITRATAAQVKSEMARQGFTEVDLAPDWEEVSRQMASLAVEGWAKDRGQQVCYARARPRPQ